MYRVQPFIALVPLILLHILILPVVTEGKKSLPKGDKASVALPSPLLKISSLEYDGLASDFMFIEAIAFFGGLIQKNSLSEVKAWEWKRLHDTLKASTELDPYFLDPYYVGQAQLPWEANMVRELNTLLEKGSRYRDWDWMLPFFIGFNHFYFLHEDDKASEYLMEASRRPGASPMLASLATRLAYKGKRTENAIIFLQELLKKEEDEWVRKEYQTRLEALKMIYFLEQAVTRYVSGSGKNPSSLKELVSAGIITDIPKDPYGGDFYIDADGSIKTTSELRPMKKSG